MKALAHVKFVVSSLVLLHDHYDYRFVITDDDCIDFILFLFFYYIDI